MSMRVISGFLKSRVILGDNIEGTRPTMNRVKMSLFSMINQKLEGSVCLDLFAGSGSLGIEAISNGAKKAIFVDNNKKCIDAINKNIKNLKIESYCEVYLSDYLNALKRINQKLDIIFLDPPYKMNVTNEIFEIINSKKMLNEDGIIVVEYSQNIPENIENFEVIKEKKYGDKYIKVYKIKY